MIKTQNWEHWLDRIETEGLKAVSADFRVTAAHDKKAVEAFDKAEDLYIKDQSLSADNRREEREKETLRIAKQANAHADQANRISWAAAFFSLCALLLALFAFIR